MRGQNRTTTTICDCSQIDQQQVGTPVHTASDEYTTCDRHVYEPCPVTLLFRGANKINAEDFQDLVMCALRDDSGLLQVWHRQDVFFRHQGALTPDIRWLGRPHCASASLLQMLFMESRHYPVPFWVLTRWETVRMLVWHRLSRSSLGHAYWSTRS